MKKTMLLTITATGLLAACTLFEPDPILPAGTDYSIIDGDTVKTRVEKGFKDFKKHDASAKNYIIVGDTVVTYKAPKLHTPPSKVPDLSKLKNNEDPELKGKPLRMVAIGGSLTAGVRDGGYFNEGMMTSYPNLIARQMGIKFEQPYFDADSYNGFGRKVKTDFNPTGGPVPKFKEVSNNSGVELITEKDLKLKKFKGQNLDGFATKYASIRFLGASTNNYTTLEFSKFASRLFSDKKQSFFDWYKDVDFDFFILETRFEDRLMYALSGGTSRVWDHSFIPPTSDDINLFGDSPNTKFMRKIFGTKLKRKPIGFISNIPDILDFPIFKIVSTETAIKNYAQSAKDRQIKYEGYQSSIITGLKSEDILIPSLSTDSLLSPKVHIALKKGVNGIPLSNSDVLDTEEQEDISGSTDPEVEYFQKRYGVNIVDIRTLYKKIIAGGYTTNDGVLVDASYPSGNFFSSDGYSLTPFGQAVVANEFLRTMNNTLKMEIPLISTANYLK